MQRILWLALCLVLAIGATETRAQNYSNDSHFRVYFVNTCNRRIQTAVHFRDLSGNWITEGWWTLEPGEQAFVAQTTNRIFYMYAESIGPVANRIYWDGSVRYFNIRGSRDSYGFRQRNMDMNTFGRWTERFNCN
jgi:uncharacterized membrane protein